MLLLKLSEEDSGRRKEHFQTGQFTPLSDRRRHLELVAAATIILAVAYLLTWADTYRQHVHTYRLDPNDLTVIPILPMVSFVHYGPPDSQGVVFLTYGFGMKKITRIYGGIE